MQDQPRCTSRRLQAAGQACELCAEAAQPEDWDEEEDGEWEAPKIRNPKCDEAGCGEWSPKKIPNPAFKGKWSAELIDNPDYKVS